MNEERFCCWCGKVEYTEVCQSKSIKKVAEQIVKSINEQDEQK